MAFFTTHQCSLFCSSTLNAEETKKLDGFMELLEESNVGEIIKDATKRDTSKGGRNGVNPYHLFATILYAFSNHSGTLRKIEESIHYDLRYMYLMEYESASYVTISEFLNNVVVKHHRKLYSNIVKAIIKKVLHKNWYLIKLFIRYLFHVPLDSEPLTMRYSAEIGRKDTLLLFSWHFNLTHHLLIVKLISRHK